MDSRRLFGFVAMFVVWAPSCLLILRGVPRLPVPFVVDLAIVGLALPAALKAAYLLRAWIDPSFDPDFGAHRMFERGPEPPRRKP